MLDKLRDKLLLWIEKLFDAPEGKENDVGRSGLSPDFSNDPGWGLEDGHPFREFLNSPVIYLPRTGKGLCVGIISELWTTGEDYLHSALMYDYVFHSHVEVFGGVKLFSRKHLELFTTMTVKERLQFFYPDEPELHNSDQELSSELSLQEILGKLQTSGFYQDVNRH